MTFDHHVFIDDYAGRCGVIVRRLGSGRLDTRTLLLFDDGAPVYRVDHSIVWPAGEDVTAWSSFTYTASPGDVDVKGERAADGAVTLDGKPAPTLDAAVPSYAEHLLVLAMIDSGADETSFRHFSEADPHAEDATLTRRTKVSYQAPDGRYELADAIDLHVAGVPTNTHYVVGGLVVCSDWGGATSLRVDDEDNLLDGLGDAVVGPAREFLSA